MKWLYNILNKTTNSAFFYTTMLLFLIAFISSCSKDFLDKPPLDAFSDDAVWQDQALIQAYINNTYRIVPIENGGFYRSALSSVCDECYFKDGNANNINAGNLTPATLGQLDFWTSKIPYSFWAVISKCNIFLSNIETSPVAEKLRNNMIGEIKFLRAYSYFKLVAFHGGVPLITSPFSLTDDFNVPRNSYDECMDFVINELDESSGLLPLDYNKAEQGKITKGAALALKSRALLYMASPLNNKSIDQSKWQAAADAAKAVIDLNKYKLFPKYKDLFLKGNSYNSEVIWSRPFNSTVDFEDIYIERALFPNGFGGASMNDPLQNLIDDYEMLSGRLPKDDPEYNPQNPYVNRDPRFYASILFDGAIFQGRPVETFTPKGKDSPESSISPNNASLTAYNVRKFVDESIIEPRQTATNNGNSPFIFIRYAEVLLNYAEASYFLGDEVTCRKYINEVRGRPDVNMPPVTEGGTALLARLQNERRIELVFEDHRWFDVRRWKIAPIVLNIPGKRINIIKNLSTGIKTYTIVEFNPRAFQEKDYLLPIPNTEIERNPLLIQNPFYDK
jgi:hypothetical protein